MPPQGGGASASNKVKGPALGMLISTIIGVLFALLSLALNILGLGLMASVDQPADPAFASLLGQGVLQSPKA